MTINEKLQVITENSQKLYDAGVQNGNKAFWDDFQLNGTRTDYTNAFYGAGWTDRNFRPTYDIVATNCYNLFQGSSITDLAGILQEQGVVLDTSQATNFDRAFQSRAITHIPEISTISANSIAQTFGWASSLITVDKFILREDGSQTFNNNVFASCSKLENIVIEGKIGSNNITLATANKLSHDSLMSFINALIDKTSDTSGTVWTFTLGATNLAKLSDEEKAIATARGWQLK